MKSRFYCFCKVVELGNFTRAAEQLGYSQSAVSQMVKTLESELGATLIERRKDGVALTKDGEKFFPYIRNIVLAETALEHKKHEMAELKDATVTIASYTSTGVNFLPQCIKYFKEKYPTVKFVIKQGDHTDTQRWINEGVADLGFIMQGAEDNLETEFLYDDAMMAVVPQRHPLAEQKSVSLQQLAEENFILLDEGRYQNIYNTLQSVCGNVQIDYQVYDDYTIMAMVKNGLGVSVLYRSVIPPHSDGIAILPIDTQPRRTMLLAWKRRDALPLAAQKFADLLIEFSRR